MLKAGEMIWIVEDDRSIADTLVYALHTDGFASRWFTTGGALIVLDLGLPDVPGFELLREIRRGHAVPVIIATARDETVDRIAGLEAGADDYVTKPFSPREVTARVRAVLRRSGASEDAGPAALSRWQHDSAGMRIAYCGVPLDLTRYEYRLLAALLGAPGRVFSRDQLMAHAWEDPGASSDRTVDAHIKTLRAKLRTIDASREEIQTRRGLGYSLRRAEA